ncbi:MAG: hypothetical protein ACR2O4_01130 [Hyphomicrobiaceae bacterium]
MRKKFIISLLGASLLGTGLWFAFDYFAKEPVEEIASEPVPECDSCSARHKAYDRAKKSWNKKEQTSAGEASLPKLLPDVQ